MKYSRRDSRTGLRTRAKVPELTPLAREDKLYYRENLCFKNGHSFVMVLKGRLSYCRWCGKVVKPEKKFTSVHKSMRV